MELKDHFSPGAAIQKGLPDNDLLDLVQRQTLRYFWDYAHPVNGMARERKSNISGEALYDCNETVTTGGTGFGIMALIAGVERGWLPRADVVSRITAIMDFLERSEKHNGIFPHFLDARTGKANHFIESENGSNIVETAFLMIGLLAARQYFSSNNASEQDLRHKINHIWHVADWTSHRPTGRDELRWLNHPALGLGNWPVTGWNEALVTHIVAASSPTHPVQPEVYQQGWANGPDYFKNGKDFHSINLALGPDGGGPLFFSHYSFLGIDPRGLKDRHADYESQNRNHTLINYAHCVANPHQHKGYGRDCWGLTASDTPGGYDVHCPQKDLGTISPTAALSAFPYTPDLSMRALRHFYEDLGDRIWGEYGFYDAFNEGRNWCSESYLAIDQGPIVVMIENHRSGLLWNLVMNCPEIKNGLKRLSFQTPYIAPGWGSSPARFDCC